ncbi:MAG: transporter [Coraliomargaritaceae bacterium]
MKNLLRNKLLVIATSLVAHMNALSAGAGSHCSAPRPDGHAPISIMGDHTHGMGEWMLSYRHMNMYMEGMRHGTNSLSSSEVFSAGPGYVVVPEEMSMQMHMIGAMYAPNNQFTLMLMTHYLDSTMDHRINPAVGMLIQANGGSESFTTYTDGFGDTKVTALYQFYNEAETTAHLGIGMSLPTGSIDEEDTIPMMGLGRVRSVLPAPMQLGSGTYDLLPSVTLSKECTSYSYGIQASGVLRLEKENKRDYRLGHQFKLQGWAGIPVADWVSLACGLEYEWREELQGDQENINQGPAMMGRNTVTTAYGENYGGESINAILSINLLAPRGQWSGHRLAADLHLPLYRNLNGYQLETDYTFTLGWQKAW